MWTQGFDHSINSASGVATDFLEPFRDPNSPTGFRVNFADFPAGQADGWGYPGGSGLNPYLGWFNAVHMSVIPKGERRGQVVVWNRYPVLLRPGVGLDGVNYWSFQAWSIVNPDPVLPRFRNFLLPIGPHVGQTVGLNTTRRDLFCAGHCWSQHGDLVIAGATEFVFTQGVGYLDYGLKYVFLFDPSLPQAPFPTPNSPASMYADLGFFRPASAANELLQHRYYPTVTLIPPLNRLQPNNTEVAVITGGTYLPWSQVGDPDPRNTFESVLVRQSDHPQFVQRDPDLIDPATGQPLPPFVGPGTGTLVDDWLDEYPRIHQLSTGQLFRSGWSHHWATVDHEFPPTVLGQWGSAINPYQGSWPHHRKYGSSLFYSRIGALNDLVVRLGGGHTGFGETDTAEFALVAGPGTVWGSLGQVPGGPRMHSNAVILPDGSILVVGGNYLVGTTAVPAHVTALYRHGIGWSTVAQCPTPRLYHGTMVLLPDGRVLVGGGENLHFPSNPLIFPSPHDYDIYEPPCLHSGPRPAILNLPGVNQEPGNNGDGAFLVVHGQQNVRVNCGVIDPAYIDKLVLIPPGSCTHHSDMSARYIELVSTAVSPRTRDFNVPSAFRAPRGYYMLFALTNGGVPSVARWVKIQ